jgi:hypothetical protein
VVAVVSLWREHREPTGPTASTGSAGDASGWDEWDDWDDAGSADDSDLDARGREADEQSTIAIRTARMLGVAMSMLFVSLFVVNRSNAVLEPRPSQSAASFTGRSVLELRDDDSGTSLFSPTELVPGNAERSCITIVYEGDRAPAAVEFSAEVGGELSKQLSVVVDVGTGGSFGDCSGFRPERRLFEGTLTELGARTATEPIVAYEAGERGERRTFSIRVELPLTSVNVDGKQATANFEWRID